MRGKTLGTGQIVPKEKERAVKTIFIQYPKCSTCKKAKKWLEENNIEVVFDDNQEMYVYADDFYAGQAALSYNHYGAGTAWYIGALFEKQLFIDLLHTILPSAGVYTVGKMLFGGVGIPDGVFITSRENSDYRYVFIQNYNRFTVILPTVLSAEVSVLYGKNTGVLRPLETIVFKVAKSVFE